MTSVLEPSERVRVDWARRASTALRRRAAFLGYLVVQLFIVAGLTTPAYPDTATYTELSFTGHAPQLPTVPLLYTIFPTDAWRVFAQAVIAGCCWWALGAVAASLISDRRVRIGTQSVLLALGIVGPIASWNTTLLSESSAISLTAALVAAWLRYASRPSWRSALLGIGVTIAWTFTRQAHVVLGLLIAFVALAAVLGRHRNRSKVAVALALCATSAVALVLVGNNDHVTNGNLADIVEDRILPNPGYTTWFVDHGMPYTSAIAQSANGSFGDALIAIPAFASWASSKGESTYVRFMLEHPAYTWYDPLPYFSGERASVQVPDQTIYPNTQPNPTPSLLSPTANYGRYREVLPLVLSELLFEQGQIGDVIALGAAAAALFVLARRRSGRDDRQWIPMLLLASVVPQGYFVWLLGGVGELDRLSIVAAVSCRIALWLIAGLALDHYLATRTSSPS